MENPFNVVNKKQLRGKQTTSANQEGLNKKMDQNNNKDEQSNLSTIHLSNFIRQKIDNVNQLYSQLIVHGASEDTVNVKGRSVRYGQACMREGQKCLQRQIGPALEELYQYQRQCFKKINGLQDSYEKTKAVLKNSQDLSDIEIEKVLSKIQQKIEEQKKKIDMIENIVKKGKLALNTKMNE